MRLNDLELYEINGGFSINATFINAIARIVTTILDVGRSIGSSIRRYKTKNMCM